MESLVLQEIDKQHRSCWMVCQSLNTEDMIRPDWLSATERNLAQVVKAKGRLSNLIEKTDGGKALKGTCGIGHTRWATHGEPSQTNAHPHVSGNCTRSGSGTVESEVVGVHNGIIENYTELKEKSC